MTSVKPLKLFVVSLLAWGVLFSCASQEKDLNTAEGLFAYAKEFQDAERYEVAMAKYAEVRNKFPYSNLATEAELAIADVHYARESYTESEIAYQNFRDLHPKHPKSDYVLYRIAMSYYMQLPETIDRDLSVGKDAIYHFIELVKIYPKSEFAADSKTKRDDVYSRLAQKELYIADFYFHQEKYSSALRRYESTLYKYPGLGFDPRAHLGAVKSAQKISDKKKEDLHAKALTTKFPNSDEAKKLKREGL
jgi:outer membrane protein assembly factor BamD